MGHDVPRELPKCALYFLFAILEYYGAQGCDHITSLNHSKLEEFEMGTRTPCRTPVGRDRGKRTGTLRTNVNANASYCVHCPMPRRILPHSPAATLALSTGARNPEHGRTRSSSEQGFVLLSILFKACSQNFSYISTVCRRTALPHSPCLGRSFVPAGLESSG